MAVVVGEAAVRLRPETSGFSEEAQVGVLGPLGDVAKKAAGLFAAAFAAEKVGEFLKDAVGEASDVSESTSKVGVVFGNASKEVLAFAQTSSSAMGLSRAQALEATGTYGNLFRAIGLGSKQSADMSVSLTKLAGDLASFNNTDPTQALEALRSGLIGETEPLRQYGVNLNQAQIQQEAVRLGLAQQGKTLTTAVQAQAAYSLIMKQTALAQGDFARTSGGLANQQRIMGAQFSDLKANVGAALVPFVQLGAVGITHGLLPPLLAVTSHLQAFGTGVTDLENSLVAAYQGVNVAGDSIATTIGAKVGGALNVAEGDWYTFTDAMHGGGVGMLATESSFVGSLSRMGNELHGFAQYGAGVWLSLGASIGPALAPILPTVHGLVASLTASLGGIGGGGAGIGAALESGLSAVIGHLVPLINAALPIVTGVLQQIIGQVQAFLPILGQIFAQIGPVVSTVFSQLGPLIGQIIPVIMQVAGLWQHVLLGAFQQLLPVLPVIVQALGQLVTTLVGGLAPVFSTLAPVIGQVVTTLQGALVGAISALVPVIPPLVKALSQVVGILGGALISVIQALAPVIPVLVGTIGQLASIIAAGLGKALAAIVPILPQIAQLLGDVAKMLAGALAGALQAILPILPPLVSALVQVATTLVGVLMSSLSAILPIIPELVQVFVLLIDSALVPLLPILPILANLVATVISAIAPLIPTVIQVATLLIRLAIAAIMPMMPILVVVANLFTMLIHAIIPIIQVVITVAGAFIGFASTIIRIAVGLVSTVLSVWTGLMRGITGIFRGIFSIVSGIWNSIFGFVSGIVARIAGAISGAFRGVGDAIGGVFSGVGRAVSGAFSTAVGAVKGAVNSVIGVLNSAIGFINSKLIDTANKVPFVSIPHIPAIPRLHEGGFFETTAPAGEGLALLRNRELVATPEQQRIANDLLGQLLAGALPATAQQPAGAGAAGANVQIQVNAAPGMSVGELSARVGSDLGWQLAARTGPPVPVLGGAST